MTTIKVGIFGDPHIGAELSPGIPPENIVGQESADLATADIYANVPLDFLMSVGDNTAGGKMILPQLKNWIDGIRAQGIPFSLAEGNHDPEIFSGAEFTLDNGTTGWQWGHSHWTDYPFVETTLSAQLTAGATYATVADVTGFSDAEPWVFFWDEAQNTAPYTYKGELKRVTSIDVPNKRIHFDKAMQQTFTVAATQVMQGRDKDYTYGLLRDAFGEGDAALGSNSLSRYHIIGNNVFVTLAYETYYDNPGFPNPDDPGTGHQNYISATTLSWLENLLDAYPNYNFFVVSHVAIEGSGIYDPYFDLPSYGNDLYYEGNSAAIQTLCQNHPNQIAIWFTGHGHYNPFKVGAVTQITPESGWGGCTFVGCPALARYSDVDVYANLKSWYYYLELTEGSMSATLRLRDAEAEAWEDFDYSVMLPFEIGFSVSGTINAISSVSCDATICLPVAAQINAISTFSCDAQAIPLVAAQIDAISSVSCRAFIPYDIQLDLWDGYDLELQLLDGYDLELQLLDGYDIELAIHTEHVNLSKRAKVRGD